MLSPVLAFCSGPSFVGKSLEMLESDGLQSPDRGRGSYELGTHENAKCTLKEILFDKRPASPVDDDDTTSVVSETSTCSSVVALATDENEFKLSSPNSYRKFQPSSSVSAPMIKTAIAEGHGQSSSEAEDEETARKVSGRMSKRLSELFSFSGGNNASGDENINELKVDKKRRGSISRKISPLPMSLSQVKSAMFSGVPRDPLTLNPKTAEKLEPEREKEQKKVHTPRPGRKLSLTMFKAGNTASKSEETKKRRNTDPVLNSKQKTTTILEGDEPKIKSGELSDSPSGHDSPERIRKFTGEIGTPKNGIEPELAFFKEEDIKMRNLMEEVLQAHLLHMSSYRREACDRAGRNICAIIKTLIEAMKETEDIDTKVVCLVYIGAVRDEGIFMSAQALWNSDQDNFAAVSYRNDAVYGMAIAITTPVC